jgi:hypothetical protein
LAVARAARDRAARAPRCSRRLQAGEPALACNPGVGPERAAIVAAPGRQDQREHERTHADVVTVVPAAWLLHERVETCRARCDRGPVIFFGNLINQIHYSESRRPSTIEHRAARAAVRGRPFTSEQRTARCARPVRGHGRAVASLGPEDPNRDHRHREHRGHEPDPGERDDDGRDLLTDRRLERERDEQDVRQRSRRAPCQREVTPLRAMAREGEAARPRARRWPAHLHAHARAKSCARSLGTAHASAPAWSLRCALRHAAAGPGGHAFRS